MSLISATSFVLQQKTQTFSSSSIAGGHQDRFFTSEDLGPSVIIKETNSYEAEAYEKIFSDDGKNPRSASFTKLRNFLPKYYGSFSSPDGQKTYIMLENLLQASPHASILDLKMGTSTVSARKRAKRNTIQALQKDQDTTTVQLGFRVTGYIIKDAQG